MSEVGIAYPGQAMARLVPNLGVRRASILPLAALSMNDRLASAPTLAPRLARNGTDPSPPRADNQAAGIRCSTIPAHQLQPAGIASSLKLYIG
ncbi:hypothetical protein GCM10007928_28250 [Sulfitobacter porphyrae]|nr:hypothetical protein GCM10007928_28250 [Sulfitobacter porphyrae]